MDVIKQELEKLFKDGLLNPEAVVSVAKAKNSPLHEHFTWDNGEAAHQYRLVQARALIRSVVIEHPQHKEVQIRAYVSLPSDRAEDGGYRKVEEVMSNEFMRRQLADDIEKQCQLWERKAAILGVEIKFSESVTKKLRSA